MKVMNTVIDSHVLYGSTASDNRHSLIKISQ